MEISEIDDWIARIQKARALINTFYVWQLKMLREAEKQLRIMRFRAKYREEEADE